MKITHLFILPLFFCFTSYCQQLTKIQWENDLNVLQKELLQKEYLFHQISKTDFKTQINNLKTTITNLDNEQVAWNINKLLSNFKTLNLTILKETTNVYPFNVKSFKNGFYLTKINKENNYLLNHKLVKINGFSIQEIETKLKSVFYLPHSNLVNNSIEKWINSKSLLSYLNIQKTATLTLTFTTKNNKTESIDLPYIQDLDQDLLAKTIPKKTLFNQRKNNTWFWKYGINFGKQVFLKYSVCLSKEHIVKMKDSLNMSSLMYAKAYKIHLQNVYDAPEFNPFVKTIIEKFNKRRYKKLIIDLRNTKKGSFLSSKPLIKAVSKLNRINKNGRLFILTNKNTSNVAIAVILAFQKQTKVKLIGETVFGTKEDSNKISYFTLPNSKLEINYPLNFQKEVLIKPNITIEPTLNQYINGVDGLLQKALDY